MRVALFILCLALGGPALAATLACGDCDGNGAIQIVDALLAAQHSTGVALLASPNLEACDVVPAGGDGVVAITDALFIAQRQVGLVTTLDCVQPTVCEVEEFDTTAERDDVLTDAEWGTSVAGKLTASMAPASVEAFGGASSTSSVPFRDQGARTQLLFRPADLGYRGGTLLSMQLFLGGQEESGRRYDDLEVRACHTTVNTLGTIFQSNYAGNAPVVVRPAATRTYAQGQNGDPFDLQLAPGAFTYDGVQNLLIEIVHRGATATTVLQVEPNLGHAARLHASDPNAASGFATMIGTRARIELGGTFPPTSEAVSLFHDTGSVTTDYLDGSLRVIAPAGTSADLWFQGAHDDGTGQPFLPSTTGWLDRSSLLDGYRHIRFKVVLHSLPLVTPEVERVLLPYTP